MNKIRWFALWIAGAAIVTFTQFPYAATMQTRGDYAAALDRVYMAYQNARTKCGSLAGHDRDMCVVAAHATEKRSKAMAAVNYKGTTTSKVDSRIADADADLMIARVACGARTAREKDSCVNVAKAANVKLVADASATYAN